MNSRIKASEVKLAINTLIKKYESKMTNVGHLKFNTISDDEKKMLRASINFLDSLCEIDIEDDKSIDLAQVFESLMSDAINS